LVFGFSEVGVLGVRMGMKPGKDPSPPETLKKAGAAEQMRDIKDLRKKCRSRPGADPEQTRSRPGADPERQRLGIPIQQVRIT
jgi:hypothetical protein